MDVHDCIVYVFVKWSGAFRSAGVRLEHPRTVVQKLQSLVIFGLAGFFFFGAALRSATGCCACQFTYADRATR
jgi:hypothetical protein